ncbi:unnamed protein product [Trichogramma brassicae]|uniref:Uncharacterized protein n=1 Tax=Trichogramma brassicae TaxID=86971 RepID=A0A6H5IHU3_9HYME|nr:unnamed protein product [Trichogramma brassicae]
MRKIQLYYHSKYAKRNLVFAMSYQNTRRRRRRIVGRARAARAAHVCMRPAILTISSKLNSGAAAAAAFRCWRKCASVKNRQEARLYPAVSAAAAAARKEKKDMYTYGAMEKEKGNNSSSSRSSMHYVPAHIQYTRHTGLPPCARLSHAPLPPYATTTTIALATQHRSSSPSRYLDKI